MNKTTRLELIKEFPNRNKWDILIQHTDSVNCTKYYWENDGKELDSAYFDSSYFSKETFKYEKGTLCFTLLGLNRDLFREHIVTGYYNMINRHAVEQYHKNKHTLQLTTDQILPFKTYWFIDSKGWNRKGYYFDSLEERKNIPVHYKREQELYKYRKAIGNVFDTKEECLKSKLHYQNVTI